MLNNLYQELNTTSPVAVIIISISLMLMIGFLMTRLTNILKLPSVTAYIITGILLGPHCLNLVPKQVIDGTAFLPDIALAFIAFLAGEFFRLEMLQKSGWKVIFITICESLLASLLIFITMFFLLKLPLSFSVILAALAAATAPASIMMIIRQTGSKGAFVDTLLQVVALDDIVGLIAYSVSISIALSTISGQSFSAMTVIVPLLNNIATIILGGVFGYILKLILTNRTTDNRLIVTLAMLFAFCGICAAFDISPLLGCMAMATIYINTSNDNRIFRQLGYFSPPILLLFFVRAGLSFKLDSLTTSQSFGNHPLIIIGVAYFIVRIVGKYFGAFLSSAATHMKKEIRNYLGLALIPQAGVAIGLAALGARTLGGEMGISLETIILASSVLYELIGPACAKLSLYLSHSFSNNLDKVTEIKTTDENEQAFTEAAEEQYGNN